MELLAHLINGLVDELFSNCLIVAFASSQMLEILELSTMMVLPPVKCAAAETN